MFMAASRSSVEVEAKPFAQNTRVARSSASSRSNSLGLTTTRVYLLWTNLSITIRCYWRDATGRTLPCRLRRKQGFQFATRSIRGQVGVDGHVVPHQRLALSHRTHQLHVMSEPQRQPAEGERRRRRQELAPDRVSAFATTSALKHVAAPVASPRSPTDATVIPTSRPIRCHRL